MRFAIASDLHCHVARKSDTRSALLVGMSDEPRGRNPVSSLLRHIEKERLTADYLLCPGDLADRVDLDGLRAGWESVSRIGEALGVRAVLACAGNHDIDSRGVHGGNPTDPVRTSLPDFPVSDAAQRKAYWDRGFALTQLGDVSILIVCSSTRFTSQDQAKQGILSESQCEHLEELLQVSTLAPIRVALVHHHPQLHEDLGLGTNDVMMLGSRLLATLEGADFQLVVHGHKHHARLTYAAGLGGSSPAVLASGSLAAILYPLPSTASRNLFHLVELGSTELKGCTVEGEVRSYEWNGFEGWNPASQRSAGIPFRAGFGCRWTATEIRGVLSGLPKGRHRWSEMLSLHPQLRFVTPAQLTRAVTEAQQSGHWGVLYDSLLEINEFFIP